MKLWFYPDVTKVQLFPQGYIAKKSGHSRGSTLDVTLVPLKTQTAQARPGDILADCLHPNHFRFKYDSLDMGTAFDCFDSLAHSGSPYISSQAHINRQLLQEGMKKHGFKNLPEEWWHFTLIPEPYPNQYFDFKIR